MASAASDFPWHFQLLEAWCLRGIQQKITIKSMSIFNDTNNSINEILEMLKNYRTEGRPNTSSFQEASRSNALHHEEPSFAHSDSKMPDETTVPVQRTHQSIGKKDAQGSALRLHSSLEHIPKRKAESSWRGEGEKIFSRLYQEDKALREKREQLFASGRRQQQDQQSRQCTFSPNLRQKSGKNMTQEQAEGFYQKNIDWQRKVLKETKVKQCEKNSEGVAHLTFTPKINVRRQRRSKENVPLLEKRGVEEFLQRQQKGKHCIQTLQGRRKNPYTEKWNFKKCQFSYLH